MAIQTYSFSQKHSDFKKTFFLDISHFFFIFILEILQIKNGESYHSAALNLLFYLISMAIFSTTRFYFIFIFCLFTYQIAETLSYLYTSSGLSFRIFAALNFFYALNAMPENVMRLFFWAVLIFGFSHQQLLSFTFSASLNDYSLFLLIFSILLYPVFMDKYSNFYPFRVNDLLSKRAFTRVIHSFTDKKVANLETKYPKNVIFIQIESFETQTLGRFNRNFPQSMPFLSNVSRNSLHFSQIPSQPYTTWSAAGMLATHCGFPLIVDNVDWSVRGHESFQKWSRLPCISDFLYLLNYTQKAFCTGSCDIMDMKGFMSGHHFETFDMTEHKIDRDSVLFDYVATEILPGLVKDSFEYHKPFFLFLLNADTHPDFWIDDKFCPDLAKEPNDNGFQIDGGGQEWNKDENAHNKHREPLPKMFRSFTCVDRAFNQFITKLTSMGLNASNTVLVVYGDHLTMGELSFYYGEKRTLSILFPFLTKQYLKKRYHVTKDELEKKPITYYDFAPTIFDLLNMKYAPRFPYGYSAFSSEIGNPPSLNDFKFIYNFLTGDITYDNVNCGSEKGFCSGNEY